VGSLSERAQPNVVVVDTLRHLLGEGCSNATVNRTLALIRAILRKCARDWDWLDRAPAVRLLKEPTRRIQFLSRHFQSTAQNKLSRGNDSENPVTTSNISPRYGDLRC